MIPLNERLKPELSYIILSSIGMAYTVWFKYLFFSLYLKMYILIYFQVIEASGIIIAKKYDISENLKLKLHEQLSTVSF